MMMWKMQKEKITTFKPSSLVTGLLRYARTDARADLIAGLTVAVMGVPQAMAYALIAGLPPIYGLYTAIIPTIVAAIFGSSNHLSTGPTNAVCMVIFSLTAALPQRYGVSQLEVVLLLTFLAGFFQALFGFMNLGGVVRYVSNSVVVGFTAGAGILISVNQLKSLCGIEVSAEPGAHFLVTLWRTLSHIDQSNPYALTIGLGTIVILALFKKFASRFPGQLVAIILLSTVAFLLGWDGEGMGAQRVKVVSDIQEIKPALEPFSIPHLLRHPNLNLLRDLLGGALSLAILGLIESTSIARSIASSSGQRLDFNREFIAQGIAKLVGSCFHCFASSGSFTRSAIAFQAGGRTRMAGCIAGVCTGMILLLFGPLANHIPLGCLAGIIVFTAATMVKRERFLMTWKSGVNSRIVLGGTLAATLLMPLETAVFAGVMISIVILLRVTGKPDLTQLVQHPDYGFEEVPFNRAAPSPVAIINIEGDLYFAAAEDLDYELLHALRPETRVVVLRMKRLRAVGSSAMSMLEHFHELLHARGIHLIVCGVEEEMSDVLTGSGVRKLIGEQNIFYADNRIFQSTELALARAMSIVEMQRTRSESTTVAAQSQALVDITAAGLMQRRCLRFGAKHQTREAMWLISQFQQKMKTGHPQTVFLQDEEGKLCGEISLRSILKQLAGTISDEMASEIDDATLAKLMEPKLFQSILSFSLHHPITLAHDTPLVQVFSRAARHGFRPMPVSDRHGRLVGVFDELAMLRGLTMLVKTANRAAETDLNHPVGGDDTESSSTSSGNSTHHFKENVT